MASRLAEAMATVLTFLVILASANELLSAPAEDYDVTVRTERGLLRGLRIESARSQEVLAFLGIPYARPPVGDLRFKVQCTI